MIELYFDDWHNDDQAQQMAMQALMAKGCTELWCVWPPHQALDGRTWYRMMGRVLQ